MNRYGILIFVIGSFLLLEGADVPIIFLHGNKAEAIPEDPENKEKGGLKTWYPTESDGVTLKYPTAMTKIIGYQGYDWGVKDDGSPAIDCDINTELMPDQGTKRVFNFSFYSPDGSPGVIGGNTSEGEKNLPLWKRVSYNVGYSLGICLRGKDLTPLSGDIIFDIDDFLSLFYLLHSLEASVIYPFGNGKGIEVGVGYGWARIEDAKGWFKVVYIENEKRYLHGWYGCKLKAWKISFLWKSNAFIKFALSILSAWAHSSEALEDTDWNRISWSRVCRLSMGVSIGLSLELPLWIDKNKTIGVVPFLSPNFSYLREVWNDSPWDKYWEKTLSVSLSGLYGGIKINFGGVR